MNNISTVSGKRAVVIFGDGELAHRLISFLKNDKFYTPIGVIAKSKKDLGKLINGSPVLGIDGEFRRVGVSSIIAIQDPKTKKAIYKNNLQISRWLSISFTDQVGYGNMFGEGSVVSPGTTVLDTNKIGRHTFIDLHCLITYNVSIGDFSYVGIGTKILSNAKIGEDVIIGPGCLIGEGVTIRKGSVIQAGSVVLKEQEKD